SVMSPCTYSAGTVMASDGRLESPLVTNPKIPWTCLRRSSALKLSLRTKKMLRVLSNRWSKSCGKNGKNASNGESRKMPGASLQRRLIVGSAELSERISAAYHGPVRLGVSPYERTIEDNTQVHRPRA